MRRYLLFIVLLFLPWLALTGCMAEEPPHTRVPAKAVIKEGRTRVYPRKGEYRTSGAHTMAPSIDTLPQEDTYDSFA